MYNVAMTRNIRSRHAALVLVVLITFAASAQVVRQGGPPPEVRAVFDALVEAVNGGSAESWEAFAQARFTPAFLQQQSRDQRAELYRELVDRFGTIEIENVRRQGPDAPLQINVKGSKAPGVIAMELDPGPPPRIAGLRAQDAAPQQGNACRRFGAAHQRVHDFGRDRQPAGCLLHEAGGGRCVFGRGAGGAGIVRAPVIVEGPVFFKAYGLADREKKIPNNIRTRFNLGSINKTFTQVAIRQLVAAGKLSMTDTLGKFFPGLSAGGEPGRHRRAAADHRAGLSDFFGDAFTQRGEGQFASNADYFKFVSSQPPTFAPGERNQYCNGCYIALGAIVEKVSGMPYEKYVAEHVFARAEMTSTGYPRSDRLSPDIAQGYTRRGGDSGWRNNLEMHGVTGSAAGGGYSTALDLLTYVKALRAGKFPGANADIGIGGGAPGINAIIEASGEWVVIVLSNFDPPAASQPGTAIAGRAGAVSDEGTRSAVLTVMPT